MADEFSLRQYQRSEMVNPKKIKENLITCAHNSNPSIPDHYYKAWNRKIFAESGCCNIPILQDYFTKLLPKFAETYLELDGNDEVCVKEGMWNDWQLVAREFAPSVMKVLFIWKKCKDDPTKNVDVIIEKNFRYTCLPCCDSAFIKQKKTSLCDDHVHAGSCLEADIAWMYLMYDPSFFIKNKMSWYDDCKVHGVVRTRMDMYGLALKGKRLLEELRNEIDGRSPIGIIQNESSLLWQINHVSCKKVGALNQWFQNKTFLQDEAKLLLDALNSKMGNRMAMLLHYYLLVKGLFRMSLVVQSSQYGLEQFNYTLHAPYRGSAMDYLCEGLKQMVGNNLDGAKGIELRISSSHLKELNTIIKAVRDLHGAQQNIKTKISLVCHFIKGGKQKDLEKQYRNIDSNIQKLVGIDVAGSDFKASPGAFVPIFERLRKKTYGGHLHYTYHAGEDFFHLLDGLRTIYEAVEFLKLGDGDRMGHASAAGVDPKLWASNLCGSLPIAQGRYLDDLVFAAHIYKNRRTQMLLSVHSVIKLVRTIHKLAKAMGESFESWKELEEEWLSRKENCMDYERQDKYKTVIGVGCFDVFSPEELVLFQQEILKRLKEKNIAIETTPTSNVTIGHHHTFKTYHLLTWLKWKQQGVAIPEIVLGSDEPGVFSTNIANEYANVLDLLQMDGTIQKPQKEVTGIINASDVCAFENSQGYGIVQ